jgi:hypothetical protein
MPKYEVTLTASTRVEVEAESEDEAIEKAEALPRDYLLEYTSKPSFDEDNDLVTNLDEFKTPEEKALHHLRLIGVDITTEQLRAALEHIGKEIQK